MSGDVELAFGAVLGLVVRTFANDRDMQLGTIFAAAVVVPGPVVADLMTSRLLRGSWTCCVVLPHLALAVEAQGRKKVRGHEERLFKTLEGIAPFH